MSDSQPSLSFRLLVVGALVLAAVAIFVIGFALGSGGLAFGPGPSGVDSDLARASLIEERAALQVLLTDSERQRVTHERALIIEREAVKRLREQLKGAQEIRLELTRELAYLKRLVQGDHQGGVDVYDLRLIAGEAPRQYRYGFTIRQLIAGFGVSKGDILLSLEGEQSNRSVTLALDELPDASPGVLKMDFEHFQNCQGTFTLPEGFEPRSVVIDIRPRTEGLLPNSASFAWDAAIQ